LLLSFLAVTIAVGLPLGALGYFVIHGVHTDAEGQGERERERDIGRDDQGGDTSIWN